jgi:hypothetical protein
MATATRIGHGPGHVPPCGCMPRACQRTHDAPLVSVAPPIPLRRSLSAGEFKSKTRSAGGGRRIYSVDMQFLEERRDHVEAD